MYQRRLEIVYHAAWLTVAGGGPAGAGPTRRGYTRLRYERRKPRDDAPRIVSEALSISLKLASKNGRRATPAVNNRISGSLQHKPRTTGRFINSIPPGLL